MEAQVSDENNAPQEPIQLAQEEEQPQKASPPKDMGSIAYGEDAFSTVNPLSDVAFHIETPTGKSLKCRTKFIGIHSQHLLLLEKPDVSPQDFAVFFQRGYPIKACAISQKGEGARIYFKSKIEYVVQAGPHSIFLISMPTATQMAHGLRNEARLDISLEGILFPEDKKHLCQIRDISGGGCQLVTDRTLSDYKVGNVVEFQIHDRDDPDNSPTLTGVIKNKKRSQQYCKYGVQFDEEGQETANSLLERLSFDQAKHQFLL
ncbi:PilZ domain-containing protein [Vibrio sp. SCSIO 43135]|uniref:PilZ domain-containing protein n=1 Tax=Vibrio sp. SCSIO 43135 TaxID=2819096 RepID=UPI0020751B4E|nr:PilZ domain-containing protein [Vibrio sp. SCSIO 43135]USD43165.1 PilZ domain-containing protein [Vibrio sp. SCSIO 43135]